MCTSGRPTGSPEPRPTGSPTCAGCSTSSAARTTRSVGADVADTLVAFARSQNATQLVMGASRRSRWSEITARLGHQRGRPAVGLDRRPRDLDRGGRGLERCRHGPGPSAGVHRSPRRRIVTRLGARARRAAPARGAPLHATHGLNLAEVLLLFLAVVVLVAALGGLLPGDRRRGRRLRCSRTTTSRRRSTRSPSSRARTLLALFVFLVVARHRERRSSRSRPGSPPKRRRARAEAETLAAAAGTTASAEDPLPVLVAAAAERVRRWMPSRSSVRTTADRGRVEAAAGEPVARLGRRDASSPPRGRSRLLAFVGFTRSDDDLDVLAVVRRPARRRASSGQLRADAADGGRAGRGRRAAHRAAAGGLPRPAHPAGRRSRRR